MENRIVALQNATPIELVPIAAIELLNSKDAIVENKLHSFLYSKRVRGEWFELPELNHRPLHTIGSWLLELGFTVMKAKKKGGYYRISVEEKRNTRSERSSQEIEASIILLLESRQVKGLGGMRIVDMLRMLPHYYRFDLESGIKSLTRQGFVYSTKGRGEGKRFWLKDKR
jgi:hypothetical protein